MAQPDEASPQQRLQRFLEDCFGSTLKAWVTALDVENVQRINKVEFNEVLRKYHYPGNIRQLFNELDDDGSGEITMYEIDPGQAELWNSFRQWCIDNFRSVEEMLTRLGNTNEERLKSRMTIKSRQAALTASQFAKRIREMAWEHGQERLLFTALDVDGSGRLNSESFGWLDAEYRRIQRKMEAKNRAIHSLRKQQAREAQEQTMQRFKEYLVKKHGNLVRAWRVALSSSDQMSLPKTPFLKACALIGFSHEARDLWKTLDKDASGFASLEELDPGSMEILARFKDFLEKKYGSIPQAFASMEPDMGKKVSQKQFEKLMRDWGWVGPTRHLFQYLDRHNSKTLEEADLKFLEKWNPSPYFLVEPNYAAREEIRELVGQKYGGHFLKAWKHLLDKDGSNRCNWFEFNAACQKVRYHGDIAGAWRAFDSDLSGYITLNEIDTEANATLCEFKNWAWKEFGTVRAAFSVFDHDASNSLTFQEFRGNCRIYGYSGSARRLFCALDVNQEGTLSMNETCFLDDWEMDKSPEETRTSVEKRESRIRQIDSTVRKHVTKQKRPERLSELSCRSHSHRSLKSEPSLADLDGESSEEFSRSLKVAQVNQTLRLRADLPLIPLYTWPQRRPGDETEEVHLPHHCEERKDRERKHWVQEAADDWVFMGHFKEMAQEVLLRDVHRPQEKLDISTPAASRRKLAPLHSSGSSSSLLKPSKPTLDDLLQQATMKKEGKCLALTGFLTARLPRLASLPALEEGSAATTAR